MLVCLSVMVAADHGRVQFSSVIEKSHQLTLRPE